MKVTGERLIPGLMSKDGEIEHFHRYTAIASYTRGKMVLDAACGTGYGTRLLAEKAKHVYGIDISKEAVEYATERYGKDNISFVEGSIERLPFDDNIFDMVVSFETIEHVIEETQERFLKEIKRVLKPDGVLVMSTPNKKTFTDGRGLLTKFHFREFYKNEFLDFLFSEFKNIKIYHQYFSKVSNLISYDDKDKTQRYNFDNQKDGLFYIAVATNSDNALEINLDSCYNYPEEYAKCNDYVQVYYSEDGSFTEESSVCMPICNHPGVVSENLKIDNEAVKYIRLDPLSHEGKIHIAEVMAISEDNRYLSLENYKSNAEKEDNGVLTFYTPDPQLIFELKEKIKIKSIVVQYEILQKDFELYDEFLKVKKILLDAENSCKQKEKEEKIYFDLKAEYNELASKFDKLVILYKQEIEKYKQVDAAHQSLEKQYKKLEQEYKKIEINYEEKAKKYLSLEEENKKLVGYKEKYESVINSKGWKIVSPFLKGN